MNNWQYDSCLPLTSFVFRPENRANKTHSSANHTMKVVIEKVEEEVEEQEERLNRMYNDTSY